MHPLFGADLSTLLDLLRANGPVDRRHLPALGAALAAATAREPFLPLERRREKTLLDALPPMPAPVFILGHWRSGTTHLYNILSRADFGFVTPFAAGLPGEFLTLGRWLRPLLVKALPKTRYVDRIEVNPDSPQEDEIPLAGITPISFYHGVYFPRHFERHFHRGMFLDDCSPAEIKAWTRRSTGFMTKLYADQGRRLLIKNPVYAGRLPLLRALYPDARFIHIYRDPRAVFRSTRRFYRTLLERFAWQDYEQIDLDPFVLTGYRRLMERLVEDSADLPANRFVEISYEALEADPIAVIERIFRVLELGPAAPYLERFRTYLASVARFQKNSFSETEADRALVVAPWGPLLERFGRADAGM
jgi:hypothetical protein